MTKSALAFLGWFSIIGFMPDRVDAGTMEQSVCTYFEYLGATDKSIAPFVICSAAPNHREIDSVINRDVAFELKVFVLPLPIAKAFSQSTARMLVARRTSSLVKEGRSVYRVTIISDTERLHGELDAQQARVALTRLSSDVPTSLAAVRHVLDLHLALISEGI